MNKFKSVLLSIIWAIVILIFPVMSGVIVTVFKMNQIQIFLVQACFMLLSIIVPLIYMCKEKVCFKEIGWRKVKSFSLKKVIYFIPLLLCEISIIMGGINSKDFTYISALVFFTLMVGLSEELYFRGIILKLLQDNFSTKKAVVISALLFGIGHSASIIAGENIVHVLLQIFNAIVFGIIAAEIVVITKSLFPSIIWHFFFNFINYMSLANSTNEYIAFFFQEIIMIIYALYLFTIIPVENSSK